MPSTPTAPRGFRVGGSKYTIFQHGSNPIALLNEVSHTSPAPVAQSVAIQPLDSKRPLEIITPAAIGMGTLVLQFFEIWNARVWDDLFKLAGLAPGKAVDLADVFDAVAASGERIQVKKVIHPPAGAGAPFTGQNGYTETYENVVVSNIEDGETISVGTMQVMKNITVNYTNVTRS